VPNSRIGASLCLRFFLKLAPEAPPGPGIGCWWRPLLCCCWGRSSRARQGTTGSEKSLGIKKTVSTDQRPVFTIRVHTWGFNFVP
jgi:hypothetical protein